MTRSAPPWPSELITKATRLRGEGGAARVSGADEGEGALKGSVSAGSKVILSFPRAIP